MYYLSDLCYVCVKKKKQMNQFIDNDSDNITYYTKLISVVPEMSTKIMNRFQYICEECSQLLETVYNFRKKCLKNMMMFKRYLALLRTCSNVNGKLSVVLDDIKNNNEGENYCRSQDNVENFIGVTHEDMNMYYTDNAENTDAPEDVQSKSFIKPEIAVECDIECETELFTGEHFMGKIELDSLSMADPNEINSGDFVKTELILNNIEYEETASPENEVTSGHFLDQDNGDNEWYQPIENENSVEIINYQPLSDELQYEPTSYQEYPRLKEVADTSLTSKRGNRNTKKAKQSTEERPTNSGSSTGNNFLTRVRCEKRIRIHTEENSYRCSICDKEFLKLFELVTHLHTHNMEKTFECEVCQENFDDDTQLTQHMHIHTANKSYECQICDKKFIWYDTYTRHLKSHSVEKPFGCNMCSKKFKQKSHLTQHLRTHTGEKPYECNICRKKFINYSHLDTHRQIHSGDRPHECNICHKRFAQRGNLAQHLRIHTGIKPHQCEVCAKSFLRKSDYVRHSRIHDLYYKSPHLLQEETR